MADLAPAAPRVGNFNGLPDSSGDTEPKAGRNDGGWSGNPDASGLTEPPAPDMGNKGGI